MRGHGISDSAYALLAHARVAGVDWMISLHQTNQTAVPAEFPLAIKQATDSGRLDDRRLFLILL